MVVCLMAASLKISYKKWSFKGIKSFQELQSSNIFSNKFPCNNPKFLNVTQLLNNPHND